ncbi:MAG: hypothetical protein FJW83_11575 [Actinobacteria bacterium]|nr:hypothetical protein [Actinomycetota bacterium]
MRLVVGADVFARVDGGCVPSPAGGTRPRPARRGRRSGSRPSHGVGGARHGGARRPPAFRRPGTPVVARRR